MEEIRTFPVSGICIVSYCLNTAKTVQWGHKWVAIFSFIKELFVHVLIWSTIWTHSALIFPFYSTQLNTFPQIGDKTCLFKSPSVSFPEILLGRASTGSYRATLKPPFLPHWTPSSSHSGPADPQRTVFELPDKLHPQNTDSDGGFQPGTETLRRSNLLSSWSGSGRPLPEQQLESLAAPRVVSQSVDIVQPRLPSRRICWWHNRAGSHQQQAVTEKHGEITSKRTALIHRFTVAD